MVDMVCLSPVGYGVSQIFRELAFCPLRNARILRISVASNCLHPSL